MDYIAWAFWLVNGIVSLYLIYDCSRSYNSNGVCELAVPSGWIWVWQTLGVAIVPLAGMSPWHLIWWFPAGVTVHGVDKP